MQRLAAHALQDLSVLVALLLFGVLLVPLLGPPDLVLVFLALLVTIAEWARLLRLSVLTSHSQLLGHLAAVHVLLGPTVLGEYNNRVQRVPTKALPHHLPVLIAPQVATAYKDHLQMLFVQMVPHPLLDLHLLLAA